MNSKQFLKHLRKTNNLSQRDLSKILKNNPQMISNIENGKACIPSSWIPIFLKNFKKMDLDFFIKILLNDYKEYLENKFWRFR